MTGKTASASPLVWLFVAACSASHFEAAADEQVYALLKQRSDDVLGDREEWVIQTEDREPEEDDPNRSVIPEELDQSGPLERPEPFADLPEVIDLDTALEVAVQHNRDFQSRRESLYLRGLDTTDARFNFGPQFQATVNPFAIRSEGGPTVEDLAGNLNASQILPTGGNIALGSSFASDSLGKSMSLSLTQPLLRGAGYENSHEPLTTAERELVYEIRAFELFRQDFSIQVVQAYFDLVSQKRAIGNSESAANQAIFDRERAEALYQVGRNDEQDIFRARRREIETNDALIDAWATYRRALDDFKILMGIPTTIEIDISSDDPEFQPVRVEVKSAVEAAIHNRLDLMTQRDRIEDARRRVRISRNRLLPDVDLGLTGAYDDSFGPDGEGEWTGTAELSVEIPLQRLPERNNYRAALITLDRAERQFSLDIDQLKLDIRNQVRQLDSTEQRILLQREQVQQQQRAVTVSEFQYERGDLENRALLEARASLVTAQNSLIRLLADHFIRRLRLMRDLGLLFIDDRGAWQ